MTAREKAIEAAASEIRRIRQMDEGYGWSAGPETLGRAAVNAAAPLIESALLDRIEEKALAKEEEARLLGFRLRGMLGTEYSLTRDKYRDLKAGAAAIRAVLSQIREEGAGK